MRVLGIDDPQIWSAYLLCIASSLFAVIYGLCNWNKGDEAIYPEDKQWVDDEYKIEEEL
ncbi:MAG: hypothetical protein NC818_06095 [Candidatus Omnitrophica bacterium]|nr:hypothetical protein [Candidatus Omnitrophota bacterium]